MDFKTPVLAALTAVTLLAAGPAAPAPNTPKYISLDRLEAEVTAAEDISAIRRVTWLYGYYTDKGLWSDFGQLFSEHVQGFFAGFYDSPEKIRDHFLKDVGGGRVGLAEGKIYNHMMWMPVIHLDPGGQTAHGRWRVIAMLGGISNGSASWTMGIYENTYVKERGRWKIATVHFRGALGGQYANGWSKPPPPRTGGGGGFPAPLVPPDRPATTRDCPGFPTACLVAFHYPNIATPEGGAAWIADSLPAPEPSHLSGAARLASLSARVGRLEDEKAIERLQNAYGYYIDRGRWDQAADLFDRSGTIEVGQQGVYVGPAHIRAFLGLTGPQGLKTGQLNDQMQLAPIITVAPDGMTARGYVRDIGMTGQVGGPGTWSEGTQEVLYVKRGGVWRIQALHLYVSAVFDYDKGWGKDAQALPGPSATLPPDRPPTVVYAAYPKQVIAPEPFPNPGSGEPTVYPADVQVGVLEPAPKLTAPKAAPASAAQVRRRLSRVKDDIELENLANAYGYYVEKNLWDDVAQTMAKDGTYETAQRGVYVGREHVLAYLKTRGKEGPQANEVDDHFLSQPVITIAPDGKTAKLRVRLLEMDGTFHESAGWRGGVYEDAAVKEDGVWKLSRVHLYDTYDADYEGGWTRGLKTTLPGPSTTAPPDRPPSVAYQAFPVIADIPTHYPNPVTGR